MRHRWVSVVTIAMLLASATFGSQAAWLSGKAWLSQQLLQRAWQRSQTSGQPIKPWRWADVNPVAKLEVPRLQKSLLVLNDASGEAMAFGPGLAGGNPQLATHSTVAIGGHRDTHLSFLEHVVVGDRITLHSIDGQSHHYQLADMQVVDSRTQSLQIATDVPGMVLVTCYPFSATQTGGPLRLIARATMVL